MKLDECTFTTTRRRRASKGSSIAIYDGCMAIALIIQSCTSVFRQSSEHELYMPCIRMPYITAETVFSITPNPTGPINLNPISLVQDFLFLRILTSLHPSTSQSCFL